MLKSKMYILVKDSLSRGHIALACAHASLGGYLTFVEDEKSKWVINGIDDFLGRKTSVELWAEKSFKKVICLVTEDQFAEAKTYGVIGTDFRVMTESSLGGAETAIVFRPRTDWEPFFKSLPLLK